MLRRLAALVLATLLLLPAAPAAGTAAPTKAEPPVVTPTLDLAQALALARTHSPGIRLAAYQVATARVNIAAAPASATALAPAAALYARTQLGVTIPEAAISPEVASAQTHISYEQSVAQYNKTLQQVKLGVVSAFVEWQRAVALVAAQASALARAEAQLAQAEAAFAAGAVARYDVLQAEAQVAGMQAGLAGAGVLAGSARAALAQAIGRPLAEGVLPAGDLPQANDVTVPAPTISLKKRPDLRDQALNLSARRLQLSLATGSTAALAASLESAAAQYQYTLAQARAEAEQGRLAASAAQAELKARAAAIAPAAEALRLAELRVKEGLATQVEVQSALAAHWQAEASRIQAAANLRLALARLALATGDL